MRTSRPGPAWTTTIRRFCCDPSLTTTSFYPAHNRKSSCRRSCRSPEVDKLVTPCPALVSEAPLIRWYFPFTSQLVQGPASDSEGRPRPFRNRHKAPRPCCDISQIRLASTLNGIDCSLLSFRLGYRGPLPLLGKQPLTPGKTRLRC